MFDHPCVGVRNVHREENIVLLMFEDVSELQCIIELSLVVFLSSKIAYHSPVPSIHLSLSLFTLVAVFLVIATCPETLCHPVSLLACSLSEATAGRMPEENSEPPFVRLTTLKVTDIPVKR